MGEDGKGGERKEGKGKGRDWKGGRKGEGEGRGRGKKMATLTQIPESAPDYN